MINYAMLLGRVGKKDVKQLKSGGELTVISLATNKKLKDANGTYQEHTTWHTVSCFSKLAEIAKNYVHVGDMVFVQGEIQHRKIEVGERAGQYSYSVHANEIKFVPGNKKEKVETKKSETNGNKSYEFADNELPFF